MREAARAENPFPPEEPRPAETRRLAAPEDDVVAWYVARWAELHNGPPTWAHGERDRLGRFLATKVRALGAQRVMAALAHLLATRTHPKVSGHGPRVVEQEFDGCDLEVRRAPDRDVEGERRRAIGRPQAELDGDPACECGDRLSAHDNVRSVPALRDGKTYELRSGVVAQRTVSSCTACDCVDFRERVPAPAPARPS